MIPGTKFRVHQAFVNAHVICVSVVGHSHCTSWLFFIIHVIILVLVLLDLTLGRASSHLCGAPAWHKGGLYR